MEDFGRDFPAYTGWGGKEAAGQQGQLLMSNLNLLFTVYSIVVRTPRGIDFNHQSHRSQGVHRSSDTLGSEMHIKINEYINKNCIAFLPGMGFPELFQLLQKTDSCLILGIIENHTVRLNIIVAYARQNCITPLHNSSLIAQLVKNLPAMQETPV